MNFVSFTSTSRRFHLEESDETRPFRKSALRRNDKNQQFGYKSIYANFNKNIQILKNQTGCS